MNSAVLTRIDPPVWMIHLFASLDEHDFSGSGGLSVFSQDATMVFGTTLVSGATDIATFFSRIDSPLTTHHTISAVWQAGSSYLMQGHASLQRTGTLDQQSLRADPLFNIFWLNDAGQVRHYVVSYSPDASLS